MQSPYWNMTPREREIFDKLFIRARQVVYHYEFIEDLKIGRWSISGYINRIRKNLPGIVILTKHGCGYAYLPGHVPNPQPERAYND